MKNMLALMLSFCFLSTMTYPSDAQPGIILDNKAKETLIKYTITHVSSVYPESRCRSIREELNSAENIYVSVKHAYDGTKYGGYWVELTTDSEGFKLEHFYTRKGFRAAIGEPHKPHESCCC
ncbi:MAG TPA: hypothetical protein VLG50_08550 [Candidatus Saccharimonadales bacterium]|nr:hypothetical protein [Candidatus Saccharimonadales bacterium]